MSEVELQAAIKSALESVGVWVIRTGVSVKRSNRGTSSGVPGMPDLCLPRYGWMEVKQPGHTLSPRQVGWHERATREGVRVATVYSVAGAMSQLKAWMKHLEASQRFFEVDRSSPDYGRQDSGPMGHGPGR